MHRANARSDAVDLKHFCTFRMLGGLPLRPRYFTWKTTIGIGIYVDNKVVLQSKILEWPGDVGFYIELSENCFEKFESSKTIHTLLKL